MNKPLPPDYSTQVFAGVLGKVVGVFWGRPYEGWPRERIREKWGEIAGYVHEDQGVPLVVTDDDISGTFTFLRALADSGRGAKTTARDFGEAWLNYLVEGQSVLWWGGRGMSTEHTAYLNLKEGVPPPRSGSAALNGQVVAEQIGAQIFIDGLGLVSPGDPKEAARLARLAASVSHDGVAVHGAQVVAAMVAAAFEVKDIDALLDIGVAQIPPDSLIAQVHRDVRGWARRDKDWEKTFGRIRAKYGYDRYSGGCHMVPNHAAMVMAWAYSENRFYRAMRIAGSMGWDTDCNAGNVGAVMGVLAGLEHINDDYDFTTPFAGRVQLPTADGTDSVTDCSRLARRVEAIGRSLHGESPTPPKAWHTFDLPLSAHGWQPCDRDFASRGTLTAFNADGKGLELRYRTGPGRPARIETPVSLLPGRNGAYANNAAPVLYPGETLSFSIRGEGGATLRPYAIDGDGKTAYGEPVPVAGRRTLSFRLPPSPKAYRAIGLEIASGDALDAGSLTLREVRHGGEARLDYPECLPCQGGTSFDGWCANLDSAAFWAPGHPGFHHFRKDQGLGVVATGTRDWTDESIEAEIILHSARSAGLALRHQGFRRHYAARLVEGKAQIVRVLHGETILAETPLAAPFDRPVKLRFAAKGGRLSLSLNGKAILSATDDALSSGGVGLLVESGIVYARAVSVRACVPRGGAAL